MAGLSNAIQYFQHTNTNTTTTSTPFYKYCIAVVTTKPTRPERYFLQTMHSILIGMNSKQRDQVHIAIVVHPNKLERNFDKVFTNQDIEQVSSYVDTIITNPYKSKITKQHSSQKWIENERFTYIKALEYCATTSATWTLIIEDDAIASLRFLSQLSMS